MPRAFFIGLAALRLFAPAFAAWSAVPSQHVTLPLALRAADRATFTVDPKTDELVLELPPADLPAGTVVEPLASLAEFPVNGSIYAFHAELLDEQGRRLPNDFLHHMNVMEPTARELFLPISRRVLAAGKETGEIRLPWLLFGVRVRAGEQVLANAMLHNPTGTGYHNVRVRVVLSYVPDGRPWPFYSMVPWQLDVGFPVGDKTFDLPPGHSERSYEGSPVVSGKVMIIGAHMHEYGRTIELWDATTQKRLWHGEPAPAGAAQPGAVPATTFWRLRGVGVRIIPEHRYRVRVIYENPTDQAIAAGGMGVVGGLFIPDRDAVWPATNPGDSLYQQDLRHFMRVGKPVTTPMEMSHMHMH